MAGGPSAGGGGRPWVRRPPAYLPGIAGQSILSVLGGCGSEA
jgi:hypothetical protein